MLNYIIQVILIQVLFLAVYDFFLSKETFFTKNRGYLISTPILSFLLPLIKIPSFQKAVSQDYVVYLPELVLSPETVIKDVFQETVFYEPFNYANIVFWIGVSLCSVLFLFKLIKIINLIIKYKTEKKSDFILISIPNQTKAFSFFNYIFLGKEISESQKSEIISHELVHSKQKHSLDLIFFEILKIAMWFNPLVYLYQKRIILIHEYIADEVISKSGNKDRYINNLLSNFFQVENIAFINQFRKQSLVKKRILMMTKSQSKKMNQLKYLMLAPLLVGMLFYTSCSNTSSNVNSEKQILTMYRINQGKLVAYQGAYMSYLDNYIGGLPPEKGIEISFDELSKEQQLEFKNRNAELFSNSGDVVNFAKEKFYRMPNGRNTSVYIMEGEFGKSDYAIEEFSFIKMDKTPNFPECKDDDTDCFSKELNAHFKENFNKNIIDKIFLSSGVKKVMVDFSIDVDGEIKDVKVKTNHIVIENEVKRVISSLPNMIPAEKNGEIVKTTYRLPFTILVD
jgi:hypothetical protein